MYVHVSAASWASYAGGTGTNGGTRYIAPGQGFFVRASAAGMLQMNDAVRVHHATTFYKNADEKINHLVRLELSGNNYKDEAVVRFLPNATAAFDREFDADKLFGDVAEAAQIYTLANTPLSINTLPDTDVIKIGIHTGTSGHYSIAATEINDFDEVYLEDSFTGIFTNLSKSVYSFNINSGEDDHRFALHFSPLSVNETNIPIAGIYSNEKTLFIDLIGNIQADAYIYDISGKLITTIPSAHGSNQITFSVSGDYIIKLISEKSMLVKKVWIN